MLKLLTPALANPVSLEEAKAHLRVTGTDDDAYIGALVSASTDAAQQLTGRQCEPATFALYLDGFPCGPIDLPRPPLQSVASISYVAPDGTVTDLAAFEVDTATGRVLPAFGSSWPATRAVPSAVTVTFVAGYPTGETPFALKAAIQLLVGGLYETRESEVIGTIVTANKTVELLLSPYTVFR